MCAKSYAGWRSTLPEAAAIAFDGRIGRCGRRSSGALRAASRSSGSGSQIESNITKLLVSSSQILSQRNEVRYWFIHSHARDYPVAGLCRLLQVQRSACYAWRKRQGTAISAPELAFKTTHEGVVPGFASQYGQPQDDAGLACTRVCGRT